MDSPHSYIMINKTGYRYTINMSLSIKIEKEKDLFLAECMELQLVDYGKTLRESLDNIKDMIILTIAEALHAGKLDEMMTKLGFAKDAEYIEMSDIYNTTIDNSCNFYPLKLENTLLPEHIGA